MAYSDPHSRTQSSLAYPTLQQQGHRPVTRDALGRALVRNDMERQSSNLRFPAPNGVSAPKGPESYLPDILEAQLQPPPGSPQHPGGIFQLTQQDYSRFLPETGGRRPPGARLQALAGQRKAAFQR